MALEYDKFCKESVLNHAKKLEGVSLSGIYQISEDVEKYSAKGYFGQLIEKLHFQIPNNSRSEPDFPEINLELKTSPLKLSKKRFVSKERLVLGIINYFDIAEQDFETSDFWKKNGSLLLIFYLHEKLDIPIDYVIKIVGEWNFSANHDLAIIRKDWEYIKNMVKAGRAHELSEGQTYYLGACTKGANSKTLRPQPKSSKVAMQRAYSFKQGYVNHIIAVLASRSGLSKASTFGRLIHAEDNLNKLSIDEIVHSRFKPYFGMSVFKIFEKLGLLYSEKEKSRWAKMSKAILKIELGKKIEEFEKAEITIRTVRIDSNNYPKEAVSFPAFEFEDFIDTEWVDSDYIDQIDKRFLFVFIQHIGEDLVLHSIKFWSMPVADIAKCRLVWEDAKILVMAGKIFKCFNSRGGRVTYFSDIRSDVAHIRPHGSDSSDCYPLPVADIATNADSYTKHSFWLNKEYIRDSIFLSK